MGNNLVYFNLVKELFCLQIANLMTDKKTYDEGNQCCTHIKSSQ